MALIDFTLSNARRFYSSMGNPSGLKGLNYCLFCKIYLTEAAERKTVKFLGKGGKIFLL